MEYKVISPAYLENISGGDKAIIEEIISIFKDQVPEFVNEMNELFSKGSFYDLGLLAHKAKSSVAVMGMESTAVMLKTFELQAKEGKEPEKYESYISRFKSDTEEALKEIDDLISKMQNKR